MISKQMLEAIARGETVQFRPVGNSMTPRIKSGQLVTVAPLKDDLSDLSVGDVALCKVRGTKLLHLVTAAPDPRHPQGWQISNNHGHVNGYASALYGKVVKVED